MVKKRAHPLPTVGSAQDLVGGSRKAISGIRGGGSAVHLKRVAPPSHSFHSTMHCMCACVVAHISHSYPERDLLSFVTRRARKNGVFCIERRFRRYRYFAARLCFRLAPSERATHADVRFVEFHVGVVRA
ncbi:hypothetical protein MTO96_004173 [Rhipicephalus appendiculatus]